MLVQTGGRTSGSVILEVLATATSLLPGSSVTVNPGAASTGIDIYVPPAVGTLNLTAIGIGDPGTPIGGSSSSVEISRGQTKQLRLIGAGMNQAAGTTVTVSGGGVTLDNVAYQSGNIFVNITVAASAATGARNVIVTNSNLDTSQLSGGLFIR
jgi:hypothetical protein